MLYNIYRGQRRLVSRVDVYIVFNKCLVADTQRGRDRNQPASPHNRLGGCPYLSICTPGYIELSYARTSNLSLPVPLDLLLVVLRIFKCRTPVSIET